MYVDCLGTPSFRSCGAAVSVCPVGIISFLCQMSSTFSSSFGPRAFEGRKGRPKMQGHLQNVENNQIRNSERRNFNELQKKPRPEIVCQLWICLSLRCFLETKDFSESILFIKFPALALKLCCCIFIKKFFPFFHLRITSKSVTSKAFLLKYPHFVRWKRPCKKWLFYTGY